MNIIQIYEEFPQMFQAFFFCIGACIGSFLNVCIFRIPAGQSIVRPPSHCACGKPIAWHDNLPIIGWFLLRGRARCCGRKIAFRYPLVEILTAFIFLGMWSLLPVEKALIGMAFASLMIFCTFVDLDTMTLPDFATVGGAIAGVAISAAVPQLHSAMVQGAPFFVSLVASLTSSIVGMAVGSGLVYWMRILGECVFGREAMGEGDVILAGCIGAFCGWQGALFAIFGGSLIGAILILPILLVIKIFKLKDDKKTNKSRAKSAAKSDEEIDGDTDGAADEEPDPTAIPYGPWLALGALTYYMFFAAPVDAYFGNFAALIFNK